MAKDVVRQTHGQHPHEQENQDGLQHAALGVGSCGEGDHAHHVKPSQQDQVHSFAFKLSKLCLTMIVFAEPI